MRLIEGDRARGDAGVCDDDDDDFDDVMAELDHRLKAHAHAAPDAQSEGPGEPSWCELGTHGVDWDKFFDFSPASRVIRTAVALTSKDLTRNMAVYVRDERAMFLVRDGEAFKLTGNWRRMHIRCMDNGRERMGRTMEFHGAQKGNIVQYRKQVQKLVDSALGRGCDLSDLSHIPLF